MTKKSKSKNSRSNRLSGKISNLNRSSKSSKYRHKTREVVLSPIRDTPAFPEPVEPVNELKVYRGKLKKVFTRKSWPNSSIAYITSTTQQMRNSGLDQRHLREELEYTKLLHTKFPFILNAEDITQNNEERIREGAEINYNSSTLSRIFVYKKEKVDHVNGTTPGILEFMTDSIYRMASKRGSEHFTYLDMKPANIGIKPDGNFIILDNGPDLCYIISKEFVSYFEKAAIIVGVVCLQRPLTDNELQYLHTKGLTRAWIIATFHKRLDKEEKRQIVRKAVKYYEDHDMPLTAEIMETDLILPRKVINHYCRIDENAGIENRRERIRQILNFTRLAEL